MTRGEVASILQSYLDLVRRGPIPALGPGAISAEEIAAVILADQTQVPPEAFRIADYRVSGDWAAVVIVWKHVEGADVVLRRVAGDWTVVMLGTGETAEDYLAMGVPGELAEFLR